MQRTPESGLPLDLLSEDSKLTDFRLADRRGDLEEDLGRRRKHSRWDSGRSCAARGVLCDVRGGYQPGER